MSDTSNGYEVNPHCIMFYDTSSTAFNSFSIKAVSSGDTAPTTFMNAYAFWYDTANNVVKRTADSGATWISGMSLPVCIVSGVDPSINSAISSIDQVFNGIGYIGSTVWVDKGVKGLIPNGRNADGSLKNIEFETSRVLTHTNTNNLNRVYWVICNGSKIEEWDSVIWIGYNEEKNIIYNKNGSASSKDGNQIACSVIAYMNHDGTELITSFQPKLPFRAVDYNDKSEISSWSLPSTKYIDLTLGKSGSTYTAPANGWFQIEKTTGISNFAFLILRNNTTGICNNSSAYNFKNGTLPAFVPAIKDDTISVSYNVTGNTNLFRFIYAQGGV